MSCDNMIEKISNIFGSTSLDDFPCTDITEIYDIFSKKYGCQFSGLLAVYIFSSLNKNNIDGKNDGLKKF